jgi:hypothetical protein
VRSCFPKILTQTSSKNRGTTRVLLVAEFSLVPGSALRRAWERND